MLDQARVPSPCGLVLGFYCTSTPRLFNETSSLSLLHSREDKIMDYMKYRKNHLKEKIRVGHLDFGSVRTRSVKSGGGNI